MRREGRVTVQGPVKKQQPDGMSHRGMLDPPPPPQPQGQGKGKGRGEGRLGQGGRGRSKGGEKPMGTTAYGGKGSKGRAANGDRPVGAASCRRDHGVMPNPPPPPAPRPLTESGMRSESRWLFDT